MKINGKVRLLLVTNLVPCVICCLLINVAVTILCWTHRSPYWYVWARLKLHQVIDRGIPTRRY